MAFQLVGVLWLQRFQDASIELYGVVNDMIHPSSTGGLFGADVNNGPLATYMLYVSSLPGVLTFSVVSAQYVTSI